MIQHYTLNNTESPKTMDTLFSMLDEAIDDMEKGDVISEEEMWAELAEIESD